MKKSLLITILMIFACIGVNAQIITSSPDVVTRSSKNIVLTYHAAAPESNKGLANLPSSTPIYAHIGLITEKSKSDSDWKYAPAKWGDNSEKYKLTYKSANTYELVIGDFDTYFGLNDTGGRQVKKIAMVFRTGDCKKEGKTSSGGDIFYEVFEDGFNMSFTSSITDGLAAVGESVTLTAGATTACELTINVNGTKLASKSGVTSLTTTYKFATGGMYDFEATAKNSAGSTLSKKVSVYVPANSTASNYPGGTPKMGPVANADGSVTFCIAAPGKTNAIIVGSWNDYAVNSDGVMKYQDYNGNRYFWTTVKGLDADTKYPYYFIVDNTYKVGDPYARLVLDCYNDKYLDYAKIWPDCPRYPYDRMSDVMLSVYWGNMHKDYKWSDFKIPEHHNLIIYEMLFRDFTGTEGRANANGTVRAAMEKIPYLVSLGVNAVELMPIMEFNGNNSWGYNTNFYFAPDKAYGSPEDYKDFIDECHRNGIAVILDIVFNQADGLHPWYHMYDIKANPFFNANAPHAYSVLNDWNQGNALVQQQWADCLRYWLIEYNVDGFRFDLVKGLGNNDSYGGGTEAFNQSRVDNMKRLHAVIKSVKPDGIHINENLAGNLEENKMAEDGQLNWANINYASCQFAMGYNSGASLNTFMSTLNSRTWGSTVSYAESHDEERMGYKQTKWGADGVKGDIPAQMRRLGSVAAQMILVPGPHMIWQFQELGADQTTKDANGGNDTSPKKVIWKYLDDADRAGLKNSYSELCNLRLANPDMFGQDVNATVSLADWTKRTLSLVKGNKEIHLVINPSPSAEATVGTSVNLSGSKYKLVSASYGTSPRATASGVVLPAGAYAVYATTNVAAVEDIDTDSSLCRVYGAEGRVVIEGEYNSAAVYTLAGLSVGLDNLQPGIYVVIVDGNASKVIVK